MMRIVNFSDAPGAETADKYLLTRSYMEHFNNGIKSQRDLCIYRIFITVQQFRNASRLLARFCLLYSGLQEEVSPAFLFKVRWNYVSLHCSGMTDRSQTLMQDGESADPTAQTCVELQGCGSLVTSTVVPAEIAAPVTQIPRRKWAAIKLETHYGARCDWNYNAEFRFYPHQMKCHSWQKQAWCSEQNGATAL